MRVSAPLAERIEFDLDTLAGIVDTDRSGWTRTALSQVDNDGRYEVLRMMRGAGLVADIDGAGNVIGRLPGRRSGRSLMIGSHVDTVDGGGRFDGNIGVVGAIEMVRSFREADVQLDHELVVVAFFSEEPNRFGLSCIGSRAMTGRLRPADLDRTDGHGLRFGDALPTAGIDPSRILSCAMDLSTVDAFVELHIEQGPYLESHGSQIGLVETITGISRFRALFGGRRDHAGTTGMDVRRDAGCAAAGTVLAVERIASQSLHGKGTTGSLTFTPEAVNVVTERAEMVGEFRGPESGWLRHACETLTEAAHLEGSARNVTVDVEWLPQQEPVPMNERLLDVCAAAVDELGFRRSTLFSGAEHDAAIMAQVVPTAMLFVPSVAGRSHCPEELTELNDITAGTTALAHTIFRIDRFDRPA
ncbi:Zn-dependent hydrolase [Nakamurella silvestris]|nr:Zn-dependent hydrolase [Nakamurella silvestris]